jgi:hypothetical protein
VKQAASLSFNARQFTLPGVFYAGTASAIIRFNLFCNEWLSQGLFLSSCSATPLPPHLP